MLRKEKQGVAWFEYELLQPYPKVKHAVFAQNTLDLVFAENRQKAFAAKEMPASITPVYGHQVHGDFLYTIAQKPESELWVESCDGFLTSQQNTALAIRHADCQAALFYDKNLHCIAAVHVGWRGSCKNLYKKMVERMHDDFGSDPKDLLVCISPSLGPDAAEFIRYREELPEEFWPFQTKPFYFDFWKISRWQLESAGILPAHIEVAALCTYHNPDRFYSYRRNRTTARNLSAIWLLS